MRKVRGGHVFRVVLALVAAAVLIAQLGGCGQTVAGKPSAVVGEIDTGDAGGMEVSNDGPSGPREGVPDAQLEVENGDGGEMDKLAVNSLADIYDYWTERMPADFEDQQFEPVRRLLSYDSDGEGVKICGSSTAGLVNAFYCGGGGEDAVAWDRGVLLPMLNEQFGPMSIVAVLAHEMGHAVQFRLGQKSNISQSTPTIVKEQQADCYAGGFFRYVAEDDSKHFQINTGEGLNKVLATLFFIRDPAGLDANTRGAHGLAFDRVFAFQEGFSKGPKRCAEMTPDEINGRIAEKERSEADERTKGEVDITNPEIFALFKESLDKAFKDNGAQPPEITDNGAKCEQGEATSPAAYCPDQNLVAIDLEKLKQIATPPKGRKEPGQDGAGIGDFAAFAEVASRYTMAIQKSVGAPIEGDKAGLRTACLTGAWAGFADTGDSPIRLAVGDLDEAVAELLDDNSLIAADVKGTQIKSGFARVEAFRIGYFDGAGPCTDKFR